MPAVAGSHWRLLGSGLAALAAVAALVLDTHAQPLEYPVKAAFLLNLAKFTEFPAAAFESDADPIAVCVLGPSPFGDALSETLRNERAGGRLLVARDIASPDDARQCHIVFVPRSRTDRTAAVAAATANRAVVIVGESDSVLQRGGTINLFLEDGRVRFAMNPPDAERRGVRFSSHLLRLAQNDPPRPEALR